MDIQFRSDIPVQVLDTSARDVSVIQAMYVSTDKLDKLEDLEDESVIFGKINRLMKDRHGTPFEHTFFKFYSEAPIFVYREWHRHRIGISINEQSGRYSELPPMFYVPPRERALVKVEGTKQMDYISGDGGDELYEWLVADMKEAAVDDYTRYQARLDRGVVKEVARMSLGLNIYSKMVWSCNARSLMAFLSLRQRHEARIVPGNGGAITLIDGGAMFPSKPQWEINVAADAIEDAFAQAMPLTHKAFVQNGRVSP